MQQQLERIMQLPHMAAATQHRGYSNDSDQGVLVSTRISMGDLRKAAQSSKGPYLVLPNRDTTTVTLMGHYLTWRPNLPYPACSSHCLI